MANEPRPLRPDYPWEFTITFNSDDLPEDGHVAPNEFCVGPFRHLDEAIARVREEYPRACVSSTWDWNCFGGEGLQELFFSRSELEFNDGLHAGQIEGRQPLYESALEDWRLGRTDCDGCNRPMAELEDAVTCGECDTIYCCETCETTHSCKAYELKKANEVWPPDTP